MELNTDSIIFQSLDDLPLGTVFWFFVHYCSGSIICQRRNAYNMTHLEKNIERALHFIERNLNKPLTLSEVSMECGINKWHFGKAFKALTGMTFKTHHNFRRIETAKKLLKYSSMGVTQVCHEVGFNDISYFDKVFRKFEGISPSAYQKLYKYWPPQCMQSVTSLHDK
ncbi:MAG: helix-turn-helix transcriptional regulator [Deltaproteobacteria bacterium]|nr:helix-turn-helix transcriptional regulator [Deltaproteobacteria bacterium]